jgi:hypothetical protein
MGFGGGILGVGGLMRWGERSSEAIRGGVEALRGQRDSRIPGARRTGMGRDLCPCRVIPQAAAGGLGMVSEVFGDLALAGPGFGGRDASRIGTGGAPYTFQAGLLATSGRPSGRRPIISVAVLFIRLRACLAAIKIGEVRHAAGWGRGGVPGQGRIRSGDGSGLARIDGWAPTGSFSQLVPILQL